MSQCQRCRKYVHSSCDPEADRALVQRKKETIGPDYDYLCPPCKHSPPPMSSVGEDSASCPSSFMIDQQSSGDHLVLQETSASSSVLAETFTSSSSSSLTKLSIISRIGQSIISNTSLMDLPTTTVKQQPSSSTSVVSEG